MLPWHAAIWQFLWQRKVKAQLPHALLFTGVSGVGKQHIANQFLTSLLCINPDQIGEACGYCRHCCLIKAGNHPDVLRVSPEEVGQRIKIDAIRKVTAFVNETALLGGYRVILMDPAHAMNHNAANALLKTLEEPTPQVLLLLVTEHPSRLPLTITSRCQRVLFSCPAHDMATAWLKEALPSSLTTGSDLTLLLRLADHAPLKAKDMLEKGVLKTRHDLYQLLTELSQKKRDPLQCATLCQDNNTEILLSLLMSWLMDLMRYKITQANLINTDYQAIVTVLSKKLSYPKLLRYMDHVQTLYAHTLHSIHLNSALLIEDLFIRWVQLCS